MADPLHPALLSLTADVGPLLAVDTSSPIASICMVGWCTGEVDERSMPAALGRGEAVAETLSAAFLASGLSPTALGGIVVGLGPGSFTGLRVGLAAIKGLAWGAGIPTWGVSSLALLAASAGPGRVALALDARRGVYYTALYEVDAAGCVSAVVPEATCALDPFVDALPDRPDKIVGDAAAQLADRLGAPTLVVPDVFPRAAFGGLHAADRIRRGEGDDVDALLPRYLRPTAGLFATS